MKRVTIIGGGASGTLMAINLLQNAGPANVEINLVEAQKKIGRGVAFGTSHDTHLLNVPAGKMGAFADDVGHFYKWLSEKGKTFEPSDFVPRRLYGEYLHDTLSGAVSAAGENVRINVIEDEAVDLSLDGGSAEVVLKSGRVLPSDKVVLAFGNFSPPHPNVDDLSFISADKYFSDPWSKRLYEMLAAEDSVLIIGTGLSMVDVALHLKKRKHRGKITAISTRGLLPAIHELGFSYPSFSNELKPMTKITDLLKAVRRHIERAESDGSNWRAVIDSLRPETQNLWLTLPLLEKRLFKQHLSRYWNVARHRMPPAAAAIIDEQQASGQLEILKGRLKKISNNDQRKFEIVFTHLDNEHTRITDALVNCIGSESNFSKIDSPFVKSLITHGHIRNDELSLGLDATPEGSLIGKNGETADVLFTLGTAVKGILWESTAIPDIRVQAKKLALKLLTD